MWVIHLNVCIRWSGTTPCSQICGIVAIALRGWYQIKPFSWYGSKHMYAIWTSFLHNSLKHWQSSPTAAAELIIILYGLTQSTGPDTKWKVINGTNMNEFLSFSHSRNETKQRLHIQLLDISWDRWRVLTLHLPRFKRKTGNKSNIIEIHPPHRNKTRRTQAMYASYGQLVTHQNKWN